jgi:hypothetical protein
MSRMKEKMIEEQENPAGLAEAEAAYALVEGEEPEGEEPEGEEMGA